LGCTGLTRQLATPELGATARALGHHTFHHVDQLPGGILLNYPLADTPPVPIIGSVSPIRRRSISP